MRYSIIIPTWNHFEDCLKPCIESIIKFTDLTDCEILVVANGCSPEDKTKEYVESLGDPFKLIWIEEQVGYTKAMNAGMKAAKGEFLIPFNNDNQLLPQEFNRWIKMLEAPFVDPDVMICGPWLNYCPWAERNFLIFFVVMIRKAVLDMVGYLDESFAPAYGEDTDFCCRIEDDGYKVATCDFTVYKDGMGLGEFPIFHAGNMSYKDWPGGNELLSKNRDILKRRYSGKSINIEKALACDGFVAPEELTWLANRAKISKLVLELGSWHGRSSRAIADNLPANGKLYCIDTWQGSIAEQETNHVSAKMMDGDHSFDEFSRNLWDHLISGKVIPLRMHGKHAAKLLQDKNIKADTIFIDAGHTYKEVKEDIENFLPLLKSNGLMCGHDYKQGLMPEVTTAVNDIFGYSIGHDPYVSHSIWWTDSKPTKETYYNKPTTYDCFIFNKELDLLQLRFETLYDVVDRFIVVEASSTHQRQPKPLYFRDNLDKFEKFLHKITHIIVDFPPELNSNIGNDQEAGEAYWIIERYQRNKIMDGLTQCKSNDIIIISDLDEIPNPDIVKGYKPEDGIKSFEMDLFYYSLNCKAEGKWCEAKIAPYAIVKDLSPCGLRYTQAEKIANGGKHCSYFGGVDSIIEKINSTAHREYNTDYFKNPERIKKCLENCEDIFERPNEKFTKV